MNNSERLSRLERRVPPPPRYKAVWAPIYLEPIVGSGERITIAISIIDDDGIVSVEESINETYYSSVFAPKTKQIKDMIHWISDSLRAYLDEHRTLAGWEAPFEGVYAGEPNVAAGKDVKSVLNQAISFSSFFGELHKSHDDRLTVSDFIVQRERLIESVMEEVGKINSGLLTSFNPMVNVGKSKFPRKYSFINENYSCNYGYLNHRRPGQSMKDATMGIIDLAILKKDPFFIKPQAAQKYELIVLTSQLDNPYLTDREERNIQKDIMRLEDIAYSQDISIFKARNIKLTAQHIAKAATTA